MAADQGHHMLQYYINILANAQQLLDMEDYKWKLDTGFWMWLNMLAEK